MSKLTLSVVRYLKLMIIKLWWISTASLKSLLQKSCCLQYVPLLVQNAVYLILNQGYSAGSLSAILAQAPSFLSTSRVRRLLISYPLSVLYALTFFRAAPFNNGLETLVKGGSEILTVFGTVDQFTGIEKYRTWSKGLLSAGGADSKFHGQSL